MKYILLLFLIVGCSCDLGLQSKDSSKLLLNKHQCVTFNEEISGFFAVCMLKIGKKEYCYYSAYRHSFPIECEDFKYELERSKYEKN